MFGKLDEYRTVAELAHIVLIDPDTPQAYHWSRDPAGSWRHELIEGLDQAVELTELPYLLDLATLYAGLIDRAFGPGAIPTVIPRLVTLAIAAAVLVLLTGVARESRKGRRRVGHRTPGAWWSRLIGCPWTAEPGIEHCLQTLSAVLRGPSGAAAGKRAASR